MRRTKPEKREILPDVRYKSDTVALIINRVMRRGKKSVAIRAIYGALDIIREKTGRDEMEVLEDALKNVGPLMEVRPRRVGCTTYQVPMEVPPDRRMTLAIRWIITAAKARAGKSFSDRLSAELMEAATNQGAAVRRREETHRMAEANRAFSHYRI